MKNSSSRPGHPADALTRRQLLQRFGMIGGASMMMGAMNAWDLMAAPAGQRPILEGDPGDARVLILGGGISGLVTGYELGKRGYDYTILEARDRVGGLAWSVKRGDQHTELGPDGETQICDFDEGMYFNAGPWRIPHAHKAVLGYCKELGVRLEEFRDQNTVFYSDDPKLGSLSGRKVYMHELQADLWGQTSELLAKAANRGAIDDALTVEDRELLVDFLVRAGYLSNRDQVYRPDIAVRESPDGYDLRELLGSPFARDVRSVYSGTGGPEPVFQPTGGMMEIPLALGRAVSDNLVHGAIVESVTQTPDEVRVVYREAGSGVRRELTSDYVVSCLPMSILKRLDVNFSPEMAAAVEASNHSETAKMGLQMDRRFWEEDDGVYGGHLVYLPYLTEAELDAGKPAVPIPQFSYPSNDYTSHKGILLGFYGNATIPDLKGVPLVDAPIADRIEHVLTHASVVHPQIRDAYHSAYAVWWDRIEFSRGAWARSPGNRLEQLAKPDGRLYLGAAGASEDPSWMEHAIEAAWRTVEAIHSRVMA